MKSGVPVQFSCNETIQCVICSLCQSLELYMKVYLHRWVIFCGVSHRDYCPAEVYCPTDLEFSGFTATQCAALPSQSCCGDSSLRQRSDLPACNRSCWYLMIWSVGQSVSHFTNPSHLENNSFCTVNPAAE